MNFFRARRFDAAPSLLAIAALVTSVAIAAPAAAKGTVRIQQADGSVQTYDNVTLKRHAEDALYVTTADGDGTLVITKGACSYVGNLLRCLLDQAELQQGGTTTRLDFEQGTLFANLTNSKQNLLNSSQGLLPGGVLVALRSPRGTYINISGTIERQHQHQH